MSDHIARQAAFLAALGDDDPERMAGEKHARTCAPCRVALDEGHRLVRLVKEVMPPPPPTPEALARAALAIELEARRDPQKDVPRRPARGLGWATAAAVAAGWILQIAIGINRIPHDALRIAVSLGVVGIAIATVVLTRGRRRSAVAVLVGTSGLLAYAAGSLPGLQARVGAACTAYELAAATIPWVVAAVIGGGSALGSWDMMAYAAAGALASQAAQHLTCPVAHADAHLLVFHLGGVLAALLMGLAGQKAWFLLRHGRARLT